MPGRAMVVWPTRDGLGRDHEEPAAGHRHHHVPDQRGHREGHFDAPEARPGVQPEQPAGLGQLVGHGAQRLVEAEGHVPGLAGEDREHRRQLGAEHRPGASDRKNTTVTEMKPRIGTDWRMSSSGISSVPARGALGRPGRVGEGEDQRNPQRDEHAQAGAAGHSRAGRGRRLSGAAVSRASGSPRVRLASANSTMKPSTRTAATRSQLLGSSRRGLDRDGRQDLHIRRSRIGGGG